MPCLKILTNLPKCRIPCDFVMKILPLLSKVVNKPVEKFACVVSSDCALSFSCNSTLPAAVATLESIGHLGLNENKIIIKEVSAFIEMELGIDKNRLLITLYDLPAQDVGEGGLSLAS